MLAAQHMRRADGVAFENTDAVQRDGHA